MPNEKQFDFATIAVILVSIALILGGFFLLNQSFTKKQDPNKVAYLNASSSSTVPSSSSSSFSRGSSSDVGLSSVESSSTKSSSSVISSSSVVSSSSASSVQSSSESKPSTMLESEALVKVIESTGSSYKIEVIDTGFKDGKFWKVGKQMKINSTIPLKVDQEYKLSGIKESDNNTTIGLIQEKK